MRISEKIRITFRSTMERRRRLEAVAHRHDWVNGHGEPNLSTVLNYIIDRFDPKADRRRK